MNIDKRLLAHKPISVTLNFDWENTTLDERAQMRWDYIQEQKKKDPNYVGYDFPEHFRSLHGVSDDSIQIVDFSRLVNTLGQIIFIHYNKLSSTFGYNSSGYREFRVRENLKYVTRKIHRIVACTFIPIPEHLKENRYKLVVNHKNDIKSCNLRSNLEWCTSQENTIKALESGMILSVGFKFTITRPGPYLGNVYYFPNSLSLIDHNFPPRSIYNSINSNTRYYCGFWETVPKDEINGKIVGMGKDIVNYVKNRQYGNGVVKGNVGTIISEGPCKGEQFVIYGTDRLKRYGFSYWFITKVLGKENESYKGCAWKRVTREDPVDIPIGLTEAQKEHIFGKDTNK